MKKQPFVILPMKDHCPLRSPLLLFPGKLFILSNYVLPKNMELAEMALVEDS